MVNLIFQFYWLPLKSHLKIRKNYNFELKWWYLEERVGYLYALPAVFLQSRICVRTGFGAAILLNNHVGSEILLGWHNRNYFSGFKFTVKNTRIPKKYLCLRFQNLFNNFFNNKVWFFFDSKRSGFNTFKIRIRTPSHDILIRTCLERVLFYIKIFVWNRK